MSTPKKYDAQHPSPEHSHAQPGYETTDVNINGILVFLASLGVFVVVFFILCFGMGKLINDALVTRDGPTSVWHVQEREGGKLNNMADSSQQMQKELQTMSQNFPTPRLEVDDGNQDLADIHAREELLLEHYSWANAQHTKVRIPIDQAMQIMTQSGRIPVVPGAASASNSAEPGSNMTAAALTPVTAPLTNGSAPTAYELEMEQAREQQMKLARPEQSNAGFKQPR